MNAIDVSVSVAEDRFEEHQNTVPIDDTTSAVPDVSKELLILSLTLLCPTLPRSSSKTLG